MDFDPPSLSASSQLDAKFPDLAEINSLFDDYEITRLVGAGGMGVVFEALQSRLDRKVAIKILNVDRGDREEMSTRFEREAIALAALDHPNIVSVFDVGETAAAPSGVRYYFLVMEYVAEGSLQRILTDGRLSPFRALTITQQICDALQFAHDHEVVHRDVKPANILLDQTGNVKIADFGLAKFRAGGVGHMTLTDTNMSMGTPLYMAPEQLDETEDVDHRGDIFSLGVVLYQMLTGTTPQGAWDEPSTLQPDVDPRFDDVVTKAMRRNPADRYQQASDLKSDIESIADRRSSHRKWPTAMSWLLVSLAVIASGMGLIFHAQKSAIGRSPIGRPGNPPAAGDEPVRKLFGHTDVITKTFIFPEQPGRGLSASWDGTLRLWDFESGETLQMITANRRMIDFAVAGDEVLICKDNGNLSAYHLGDGERKRDYGTEAARVVMLPDGDRFLAYVGEKREIQEFRRLGVAPLRSWKLEGEKIGDLVALPDGSGFVTIGWGEAAIRLWSFENSESVLTFNGLEGYGGVGAVAVSSDGERIAAIPSGRTDGETIIWETAKGLIVNRFRGQGAAGAQSLYFHPEDERFLVSSSNGQTLRILDTSTEKELWRIWEPSSVATNTSISPDGTFAFGGAGYKVVQKLVKTGDYDLRLWRLPTVEQLLEMAGKGR